MISLGHIQYAMMFMVYTMYIYIYRCMYLYIHSIYHTYTCICIVYTFIILIYTGIFAGFRAARLDAQMEEVPEGTPPSSDLDGGDPNPCPEDDEFFGVPDAESQEEAINRFMEGLEQQEHSGFSQIDRLISSLPVPVLKKTRCMSHAQALEGGFVPSMSEDEQNRFTPSELKLFR